MKAVHFGAGNIGRGFIGLMLANSGYSVTFIDVNETIVSALKERGEYTVGFADGSHESAVVTGVTGILGSDREALAQAVLSADLVTTAVGVTVLPFIARGIAEGVKLRLAERRGGLHVIACENTIGGSTQLKKHVYKQLTAEEQQLANSLVAFPDAAVDRIVPLQKHEDPLKVVVEPFCEWVIDRSALFAGHEPIAGVHYVDSLEPYIARKLFTVNTGHCCAAYFGYLNGYETIQQVMQNEGIKDKIYDILQETGQILTTKYGFDKAEHEQYILTILDRFANPYLTDDVRRVGRSPIRKISLNDRLVRPALIGWELGLPVHHLTSAMAAALLFDDMEDPEAAELQKALAEQGVGYVIMHYMGLPEKHPLHALIIRQYESIKSGEDQAKKGAVQS